MDELMDRSLYYWFTEQFPEDTIGSEIDPNATFADLWDAVKNDRNVYDVIGVGDSYLREQLFVELAEILQVDYDTIYEMWLHPNIAVAGEIEKMGRDIREWYIGEYPTDDMGEDIYPGRTFAGLWQALKDGEDVYDWTGAADSLVRERLFTELADSMLDMDYDTVYALWLHPELAQMMDF